MKTRLPIYLGLLAFITFGAVRADEAEDISRQLGDFFQIYVLKAEQRSAEDKVTVTQAGKGRYGAEIAYWRSLKSRDPADEICNAYRWLLLGRGAYGKGASEAFDRFQKLDEVELKFFDIEFTTRLTKKRAEVLPAEKVIPYLKVGVRRDSLAKKKPDRAAIESTIAKNQCATLGKQFLDTAWFDEKYLRQGR